MRIFVAFEGSFEPFDVSADESVEAVKLLIKGHFHIPLSEDKQGRRYLELTYAGAALRNSWSLADLGISSCSTLKCFVKEEDKPTLCVFNAVTRETMPIMESASLLGTTIRLDVWDGWKEFLMGCLLGQKRRVQRYLSREGPVLKYQRRVALYVAAFFGFVELTEWALKQGARPHEAVGAHPYRAWCHQALHADISKCPIHAAAEAGQLLILKTFVHCSVLCLDCRDPAGQTPLAIATKHRHTDCALYLLNKLWSTVSFLKISLPMRIYIKMKQWVLRAQSHRLPKSQLGTARVCGAKVGDTVMVDGFTQPGMTSKSWHKTGNKGSRSSGRWLPPLREDAPGRRPGDSVAISQRDTGDRPLALPPLVGANAFPELQRRQPRPQMRTTSAAPRKEARAGGAPVPQAPLPACSGAGRPRPFPANPLSEDVLLRACFESFRRHSGRTPRENAVYCLVVASPASHRAALPRTRLRSLHHHPCTRNPRVRRRGRSSPGPSWPGTQSLGCCGTGPSSRWTRAPEVARRSRALLREDAAGPVRRA